MPKGRRVNSSGEKSKKLLLEKAMELFSTHGYHETKISDIVKSANLTQPTFYLYFQSKESLYKDLNEQFQTDFFQIVEEELKNGVSTDQQTFLYNVEQSLSKLFNYFADNPYLTKIGFYDSEDASQLKEKLTSGISLKLQQALESELLTFEVNPNILASSIVGSIERLMLTALLPKRRGPKELASDIVNIYFAKQRVLVR